MKAEGNDELSEDSEIIDDSETTPADMVADIHTTCHPRINNYFSE